MAIREASHIRNVVFVGQSGAGKTALADALVRGNTPASGESVSDFEPEEKQYGHSLFPAVLGLEAEGVHVNLIDTPGAAELLGPTMACLAAAETVVVVVHAQNGIEPVTRQLMAFAKERRLPRCIVVNRIDMPRLDLKGLVAELREAFGPECLPINLPADNGGRVEDCLLNGVGSSDLGTVAEWHRRILDQVVELDDSLMERYLAGGEPDYRALHAVFERALDEAHVVPICFTSARSGAGVREFLSAIARHLPSPLEGNLRPFVCEQGGEELPFPYKNDATRPLLGHVFRIQHHPYLGKLGLFRVHQGQAVTHQQVVVGHSKRAVRIGHLMSVNGAERKDIHALLAGDIGVLAKIEELAIGDVIHADHDLDTVHLAPPPYPEPTYGRVLKAKTRADEEKLAKLLHQFGEEDPTLRSKRIGETHEVLVQGLGELHLRVVLDRLKAKGLAVESHPPT